MGAHIWIFYVGYFFSIVSLALSVEVTLLDTRLFHNLNWVTHSESEEGWKESSYTSEDDEIYRIYYVCQVTDPNANNWLRTPYIETGGAQRLYVEVSFFVRSCTLFPEPEVLQQCKESFKLYYYGADTDIANQERPSWDVNVYSHLDVIAADYTFEESSDAIKNTETRSLKVTHNGIYFALYDTGGCVSILSVRVYSIMCDSMIQNFAYFPDTHTAGDPTEIVQIYGECVDHAANEETPRALCSSGGTWQLAQGGCKCMAGYQPDSANKACIACEVGKYKARTGSEACDVCPAHSESLQQASVECSCVEDYYRNINDDKSMPCTQPPSAVTNLREVFVNQSYVKVEWDEPDKTGNRNDLFYSVEVMGQNEERLMFYPAEKELHDRYVIIGGLNPETNYKIIVYSHNGVSDQVAEELRQKEHIYIETEPALPPKVHNFRYTNIAENAIELQWERPLGYHGDILQYEVTYYLKGAERNATHLKTKRTSITIPLDRSDVYFFKVRAENTKGWGKYTDPISASTRPSGSTTTSGGGSGNNDNNGVTIDSQPGSNVGIIVGAAIAVIVCMVIVFIMVFIFIRRQSGQCNDKGITECDTLAYGNVTMPLFTPPGGIKTYIDPHTYEDPNQAVKEFTKEIDSSLIIIESVIGGGEFGDVCKGRLKTTRDLTVAIKTLKAGASDKNRLDFLTEASIMGQFDDPNVIYLEGVVTKSNPNMIVMEFMENGALDAFLRNNDGKFTVLQLVGMMRGIASGMRYLSDMGYVHRDLAARNILVSENLVCKVADFGLSREVESEDTSGAYTTKGGKIPVRWTAPEAIAYRKFTSAADVWSYGVTMWEVMSYGERPYWNWSNQDVIKAVDKGFRLPPPMDCPEPVYHIMLDCWEKERGQRPKFNAIVKTLDKLIRSPELLRTIAKQRPHEYINPYKPDLTNYSSVENWLASIKMERYIEHFHNSRFLTMDKVATLTLQDLNLMGICLVGHQKKIMNSVQTLREYTAAMNNAQVQMELVV